MNISVIGSGYVGTTLAACLADIGHDVVNVDIDEDVVASINAGDSPIHEEGLPELIAEHAGKNLHATTSYDVVPETNVTYITVQTPSRPDGSLDYSYVEAAAEMTGEALAEKSGSHVVAVKSTVLPGTTEEIVVPAVCESAGTSVDDGVGFVANPEFLSEGTAVEDFWDPDKIVIGATDSAAAATVRDCYTADDRLADVPVVETDVRTGEMIKYANNAFLAAKISLVNELGNVCKKAGIDSYEVADALGLDERICAAFMRSGLGWGGSCFPKDVDALRAFARQQGYDPELLDAVIGVNDRQPERMISLLRDHVDLNGARVAVLGLAFKPGTDDVRSSRALDLVPRLVDAGADVVAYDPVATENAREALDVEVEYAGSATEALSGVDATLIATGWTEFDDLSFDEMARSVVVDGRRIDIDTDALDVYEGLCW